ncbi:MAG: cupin domain-containing protein [Patescibacteria group bacterium]
MTDIKKINQTVEFQAGSVVSKEIVNKPAGSITFFAFDKEQGLSEHTAPYDALVIVTEGTAEITVSGEKNEVSAGEMLLMPAGAPHSLKAVQPFKMVLVMIKS